jgi:GrpB-like predicted nucleotidyltransferase (UPF0157 family)
MKKGRRNIKKYSYYPYDKIYPELYKKRAIILNKLLKKYSPTIEHIGSSSVPGLGGKGIIDIELSVNKEDLKKVKKSLVKNHYKAGDNFNDPERWFFWKFYSDNGEKRTVHVHLTFNNSGAWKRAISTRNFLRENREARDKYAKIKKEGVKIAQGKGRKYVEHKQEFLANLSKKAMKKYYNNKK